MKRKISLGNIIPKNNCSAEITVKRNSIRKYQNDYYLKNGQEFEILLRNNTQNVVIATIKMNGKRISNMGMVLKPGQKVYLERYFDENKKFLFETYKVDNNSDTQIAIANNGDVEISFYKEKVVQPIYTYTTSNNPNYYNINNNSYSTQNELFRSFGSNTSDINSVGSKSFNLTSFSTNQSSPKVSIDSLNEIETGRIEKGGYSNQQFENYNGEFETTPFKIIMLKILPHSDKPLETRDLVEYCTNCGTKNRKGNYKFCPKCGKRY